jgi:hypothetical protein
LRNRSRIHKSSTSGLPRSRSSLYVPAVVCCCTYYRIYVVSVSIRLALAITTKNEMRVRLPFVSLSFSSFTRSAWTSLGGYDRDDNGQKRKKRNRRRGHDRLAIRTRLRPMRDIYTPILAPPSSFRYRPYDLLLFQQSPLTQSASPVAVDAMPWNINDASDGSRVALILGKPRSEYWKTGSWPC